MYLESFGMGRLALLRIFVVLLISVLSCFAFGCSDGAGSGGDDDDAGFAGDDDYSGDTYDDDDDYYDDDSADDDDSEPPPPEPEEDVDPGTRPRICDGAVFVGNVNGDFVTRINIASLHVDTIFVGEEPTILRANDSCTSVLTLNTGDNTVSIINVSDNSVVDVGIRPGLNELLDAPGGRYALAYHDFQNSQGGSHGYGEISIIDIQTEEVKSLAIGFPPDRVVFASNDRAILASETTLAFVGLQNGTFTVLPTGLDIDQGQKLQKVAVTSNGNYALVLAEASTELLALDLSDQSLTRVELGCYPTDLDVSENGDISLLLCRQEGEIIVLDNDDLSIVSYLTDEIIGSGELTSDGELAVLFTNSAPIERVHLFYPSDGEIETYLTVKPLIGAAISPQDDAAILFLYGGDGEPIDDFDAYFDRVEAFSVMSLTDGRINPVEVPETPTLVSFGDDGKHALIPLPNYNKLILVNLVNLLADVLITPSKPVDTSVISDLGLAFALQEHPLGRISFYDVETLTVRTITGFLLNGGIEE